MKVSPYTHNNTRYNKIEEFQPCAGKGCNNQGKYRLKIIYINKSGWFCDACKQDLLSLKLIVKGNEN